MNMSSCARVERMAVGAGRRRIGWLLALTLGSWAIQAHADSVNSPNITLNVDTNRSSGAGAGNTPVTVNTITLAETQLGEYSSGIDQRITLRVRPGFQFDPAGTVTVQSASFGFNGAAINSPFSVTPAGTANELLTFNLTTGGSASTQDIIRINGIKLRILDASGAAGPAQTTLILDSSSAGGAFSNQGIVAATITRGAPDHLVFATQPGSSQAAADLLPAVSIVDFGGNLITTDARTITLSLQSNPGSAALLGTTVHDTAAGVASWAATDHLRVTTAATGYTLRAAHTGAPFLTSDTAESGTFDITAGPPGHLIITGQPTSTTAGDDILIEVTAVDDFNNPLLATSVNVTLDAAVNPSGWPLLTSSSLTKATVNGVATWGDADNLHITKAISGYRLAASGLGATVFSDAFDITPGTPNSLRFVQQPSNTVQGVAMSPPVTVEVLDSFGNRSDRSSVTITLNLSTAPCGGALSGVQAAADRGLATFDALTLNTPCNGDTLGIAVAGLAGDISEPFNVTATPGSGNGNGTGQDSGNDGIPNDNNGEDNSGAGTATRGLCGLGAGTAMVPCLLFAVGLRLRLRRRAR